MIKPKKIRPVANYILTTKNTYDGKETENGVLIPKGTLKEYQKVLAVGPMVRSVREGELVSINPKRYAVTKYRSNELKGDIEHMQKIVSYNIPELEVDGKKCLLVTDSDIEFVVEDYTEEESSGIILPEQKIIV